MRSKLRYFLSLILSFTFINVAIAQTDPFNCDYNAYLFQRNDVFAINLASGSYFEVATDIVAGNINAAGYNPADGYIWGSLSTPERTIVQIGVDFSVTSYTIPELPTSNRYVGDISVDGIYYLKGGATTYYKIDLDPSSPNYTQFIESATLTNSINVHDWAFNSVDGHLYTVEKTSNVLYRINPENGVVTSLGEVPILSGNTYTYGAVYFDASGRFYVSSNQTGTIYIIYNVQDIIPGGSMVSNLFSFGPSSSSNDGARCPTAPVPQEDCSNGIDDDGDGLVDCDDPSCSGVDVCPEITETSGGQDGGLESNNRLADAINLRNYKRKKSAYRFVKESAKRIQKSYNYGIRKNDLALQDLIPIGVIEHTEVIESTPEDLIEITNATEILAVNYENEGKRTAALMLLKTENAVYEHTKFICDRLLGSELLAVNTLSINGHEFIKSEIKNVDGTKEFVLSFSIQQESTSTPFILESHWNLSRYTKGRDFINFQLWASSVDDLWKLANELFRLIEIHQPIAEYHISPPPAVFVKSGTYRNGELLLNVVNHNASSSLQLEGGLRSTETASIESISSEIMLDEEYISTHVVPIGMAYDLGFRLTSSTSPTPDDLYLSDGPWGLDASALGTQIHYYEVLPSQPYNGNGYPVERGVSLEASINEYVGVYKAFSPKFGTIDLNEYNTLAFDAWGEGELEITILRNDIDSWQEQYKTSISLTNEIQHYELHVLDFVSTNPEALQFMQMTTLVFTLTSKTGQRETKTLNLQNIEFVQKEMNLPQVDSSLRLTVYPNPTDDIITLAGNSEWDQAFVYNAHGKLMMQVSGVSQLNVAQLPQGIYFVTVSAGGKTAVEQIIKN
ncbi:T9SS type A sorting domain-containing protein [Aureisphaera galaxeae]|uniref:T9SS type A sorting domain-containing protein n=1 Tax=Aureisphaera galaxeae TaxID=1538023 RepID=UPI002350F333|nr:T9SS type A sorting domain-containing protein [Aureisphaera galaxeae]MDC8005410.1 T9SS type A sorting domain-containing protein [Aureisphaera galaxeae]